MLDQSIVRAETTLRHHRFGLLAIGPAVIIGVVVAWTSQGRHLFPAIQGGPGLRLVFVVLALAVVAAAFFYSLRGLGRSRRELDRLRTMREAYRRERESTAP
jgi:CHASE3 domain sensor protein